MFPQACICSQGVDWWVCLIPGPFCGVMYDQGVRIPESRGVGIPEDGGGIPEGGGCNTRDGWYTRGVSISVSVPTPQTWTWDTYGWQAGGTYLTGMLSCL